MCLIVFAYRAHPDWRLVVAANRDEFYRRPTAPAGFWPDCPAVLAGRDLEHMGTWLGVTGAGRFAALTNYRDPAANRPDAKSRGELVKNYLCGSLPPAAYLEEIRRAAGDYNGFNLIVGDAAGLYYYSNLSGEATAVPPGVHGLSNHLLDTPWPKVVKAKTGLAACLADPEGVRPAALFALLGDRTPAPDAELPDTGVGEAWERLLSPVYIVSPDYGTRSSTVVLMKNTGGIYFEERRTPDSAGAVYELGI